MTVIRFAALAASATSGTEVLTTFSEKLSTGLTVCGLGMATIFIVLAILWAILALFKVIFYHEKKPETVKEAPKAIPAPAAEPTPAPATDDGALVAAITAAIAAYTADDESFAGGFRVVSFRRSSNASPWNKH